MELKDKIHEEIVRPIVGLFILFFIFPVYVAIRGNKKLLKMIQKSKYYEPLWARWEK